MTIKQAALRGVIFSMLLAFAMFWISPFYFLNARALIMLILAGAGFACYVKYKAWRGN